MPNTLTISFTPASPAPANGYRVQYWNVNSPSSINTVSPNPTSSPVTITGLAAGCYNGTVEAACGGSQYSTPIQFNACSAASCLTGTLSATANCSSGQTSTFSLATGQQATVSMSGFYYSGSGTRLITGSLLDNSNNVIQNFTYTQTGASVGTTSPSSYQITNSSGSSVTYKLQVNQVNCSGSNGSGTATMTVGNCQAYTAPGGGGGGTGTAYCVAITSESLSQASTECSGVTDYYTVYTFTLKDSTGTTTVNAPSNVTITFTGWSTYYGGGSAYNGYATINSGSSSTTATVYTYQALNGAPGCPCPCSTEVSVDTNSFAASISSPNTVSICAGSGSGGGGGSVVSYNCVSGNCVDPGDGSGSYSTLSACQAACTSGGGGSSPAYDCISGNCVETVGGPYASLLDCQAACTSGGQGGSGGSGGGGGTGGGGSMYDCLGGVCTQTVSGTYGNIIDCQISGCESAGGGGCFIEGTLVTMADGTQKPIEQLIVGDVLKSYNIDTLPLYSDDETVLNTWSSQTISGGYDTASVVNITPDTSYGVWIINDTLKTTGRHRHLVKRNGTWSFVEAYQVNVGDTMLDINNNEVLVTSKTTDKASYTIYKLDVENLDVFYANNILTHNLKQAPGT